MALLRLEPLSREHIDHVMGWVNDPDVIRNFQHFERTVARDEELAFIDRMAASPDDRVYSLFRLSDDAYVGQVAINQISRENRLGRLAIFIVPAFQGHGMAQEAIQLLLTTAFAELGLHKVWLMAWAENAKGLHLYEKLGFRREGLLREEYFWKGGWHDIVRMGILSDESGR